MGFIKIRINFYGGAMLNTMNKVMYTAFGLNVQSEISIARGYSTA